MVGVRRPFQESMRVSMSETTRCRRSQPDKEEVVVDEKGPWRFDDGGQPADDHDVVDDVQKIVWGGGLGEEKALIEEACET